MFSGAISMAAGSYLSSGAQKEIFDREIAEAEKLAEREPYMAAESLLKALADEGLSKQHSYQMVKVLIQQRNVFLRTFQEKVFGLGSAEGLDLPGEKPRFIRHPKGIDTVINNGQVVHRNGKYTDARPGVVV